MYIQANVLVHTTINAIENKCSPAELQWLRIFVLFFLYVYGNRFKWILSFFIIPDQPPSLSLLFFFIFLNLLKMELFL